MTTENETTEQTPAGSRCAPLTGSAPIATEIRKAIASMNRHIERIDIERNGYSTDVKGKAYEERTKLVDALIALVPNAAVSHSGDKGTDGN